jgi:vacuolar-type H+-ATPase subunit I/STV1
MVGGGLLIMLIAFLAIVGFAQISAGMVYLAGIALIVGFLVFVAGLIGKTMVWGMDKLERRESSKMENTNDHDH